MRYINLRWHWHQHCSGRRLSTLQMTAASCPTALGALCGQLTFRLACCREHSSVTATELSQPLDLACGTLFRSSCAIQTSPTDCSDDSWRDTFIRKHELGALWLLICGALEKHLLTYLLTYLHIPHSPKKIKNTIKSHLWLISAMRYALFNKLLL